jgi:hypothetical protein
VVRPRHTVQLYLGCQAIPQVYQQNSASPVDPAGINKPSTLIFTFPNLTTTMTRHRPGGLEQV